MKKKQALFSKSIHTINERVAIPLPYGIMLFMKREDRIHPFISGNKYRKLKYNIMEARRKRHRQLLTFGGAFSNHIAAVASAGAVFGFKTIGIIRGEELQASIDENPTLNYAQRCGMELKCISRGQYRHKTTPQFIRSLKKEFGTFYLIPEGGTNALAVKGCEEILTNADKDFDVVCCPAGTGGTFSGLINSSGEHQRILGFSAVKGGFLKNDIRKFVRKANWELINEYHFGGYGKVNAELVGFINDFKKKTGIPLDPVYTGKMMYGIADLITKGYFKAGSQLLAIHTGGLQGIAGMNVKLRQKKLPKII